MDNHRMAKPMVQPGCMLETLETNRPVPLPLQLRGHATPAITATGTRSLSISPRLQSRFLIPGSLEHPLRGGYIIPLFQTNKRLILAIRGLQVRSEVYTLPATRLSLMSSTI